MKGSSTKRIRLYVLNMLPFLLFIACSVLWLQFVPVCFSMCATQNRGHGEKVTISVSGKLEDCNSLQPVWKPVERVTEGMNVPALRKQVLIRWNKVLTSDNCICGNTSPNLVLHLQESMKNSVSLYAIQASLSNSDNSHVFYKVPMFNSSMLSSDVINCLSLIYRAMIFLWH